MSTFTVFGARGFIGAHLARFLRAAGDEVQTPGRDEAAPAGNLGHAVYCVGLTADFRARPYETMDAHVCRLADILGRGSFDSFLYLSSTRIYGRCPAAAEDAEIVVDPADPNDLYNLSKLAGESLCLAHPSPRVRVARLSNVFGAADDMPRMAPDNFLASVLRDALCDGHVHLRSGPDSSKDYVAVEDVARALRQIALFGRHRVYNVASGANVTNAEIVAELRRLCGCTVSAEPGAPAIRFPPIATHRIRGAFAPPDPPWTPAPLLDRLARLVAGHPARAAALAGETT